MQFIGSVGHYFTPGATWTISWTRGTVRGRWAAVGRSKKFGFRGKKRKEKKCEEEWQAEHRWCLQFLPWSKDETRGQGEEGHWEQSKTWERKETKDEEQKESLKILRNISPFLHQHLTLATLALIITVIFFQRRCRRSPLRMSASRNSPWPLQPFSRSKWIILQCLIISWKSFLTNFHLVTSGLARWRNQSGSTLWRPTTGFSQNFLTRVQFVELLFTGRSLPPMMRIGSTFAQLPWPATCTSG